MTANDKPRTTLAKTVKLSERVALDAALPAKGDYTIRDSKNLSSGLGLRVYASGAKSWIVQKKLLRKPYRLVLGSFEQMTYAAAVKAALDPASKLASGIDPRLEARVQARATEQLRAREQLNCEVVFKDYRAAQGLSKAGVPKKDLVFAEKRLATGRLWKMPLLDIEGKDLEDEYKRLMATAKRANATTKGQTQAGRILRSLRAAFTAAFLNYKLQAPNPFSELNKLIKGWYKVNSRTVIVANSEGDLKRWWDAVESLRAGPGHQARDSGTIADFMVLALLLGGRSTELLSLTWKNVNLRAGTVRIPKEVSKNSVEHVVPFGQYSRGILQRRLAENRAMTTPSLYVFNASRRGRSLDGKPGVRTYIKEPKKACQRVGALAEFKFTPHDLRRTFATLFDEMGVNTATLEKALNHAPSTTARKHYIVKRLSPTRKLYQALEEKILIEAGITVAVEERSEDDISPSELADFRRWQQAHSLSPST